MFPDDFRVRFRAALGSGAAVLLALAALSADAPAQLGEIVIQSRMGDPIRGLSAAELDRFLEGKTEFEAVLAPIEGLGPIFNDTGCAQCHSAPLSGGGSAINVFRFGAMAAGIDPFDPLANLGGSLLQEQFIDPAVQEFIPPEANVVAERITPPVFGAGLVEAIPDAVLNDLADNPPHPSVNGVAHKVKLLEDPLGRDHVGRFGWKAQVATLLSFSGDASLNEMGLTNRLVGTENAPNGNEALLAIWDVVPDPEDGPDAEGFDRIDRQADFQRFLAPPPQTPRSGMTGEGVFETVGCNACHVSQFTSGLTVEAALSRQTFRPYSDYLLHDVGALGDGIVQGEGTEQRIRTAPLWGLTARVETGLLHDGRATGGTPAQNLHDAILEHGGEASFAVDNYLALAGAEQAQLHAFLLSLGQLEFDIEGNDSVDVFDWFFLQNGGHFTGPGSHFTPDAPAAVADIDQDGDFDLVDWGYYQRAMTETP